MKHVNVSLFVPHAGCPHRCVFCDQKAISGASAPITRAQIEAACRTAAACPHDPENSEIAFFGGSFTAVPRALQEECLSAAAPFLQNGFAGIRISTRPDAIDAEELAFLRSRGVTAIELGAQSMDNGVLIKNGRGHTAEDTERAAELIREHGFSTGLQMMTGLYGSTDEKDLATAREFIRLRPDTVRIYPTLVLENTALAALYAAGEYNPPALEQSAALCAELLRLFEEAGVRVIRMGLHSGGDVERNLLAGPYHPAFRELCESALWKTELQKALAALPPGRYTVNVPAGCVSRAAGHKRANGDFFAARGYELKFRASPALRGRQIEIEN